MDKVHIYVFLQTSHVVFQTLNLLGGKRIDTDANAIHYLIDNGADIRQKDAFGLTALHHAALRGDEIACEQLLMYASKTESLVNVRRVS